jgi:hypothetical protein
MRDSIKQKLDYIEEQAQFLLKLSSEGTTRTPDNPLHYGQHGSVAALRKGLAELIPSLGYGEEQDAAQFLYRKLWKVLERSREGR